MAKRQITTWLVLDRDAGNLGRQLHHAIRDRILDARLKTGERLPSSRSLAISLGIARSTVAQSYDRLRAEGFIESVRGSATRVAPLPASPDGARVAVVTPLPEPLREPERFLPFRPGLPDLASFPQAVWARCLAARARHLRIHDRGYGGEAGLAELRLAIVEHVVKARAVVADPEQVIVMPSAAAILGLLARLCLDERNRTVWLEEPGYILAREILQAAGARLVPIPCDADGLRIPDDAGNGQPPRLIYVTPSHQYPTGVAMSLPRRLALLEFAARHRAIVIEDDYDSEFHYASRPLAALQGIDRSGSVAYVGTFSKVLAPGLRVAYAVLPPSLLTAARTILRREGGSVPIHVQAAVADFLNEGHLRAHVRRMRSVYETRMAATRETLRETCEGALHVAGGDGGLQLAAWFRDEAADDRSAARFLHGQGIGAMALSPFHLARPRPGLLFGIASATPDQISRLSATITDWTRGRAPPRNLEFPASKLAALRGNRVAGSDHLRLFSWPRSPPRTAVGLADQSLPPPRGRVQTTIQLGGEHLSRGSGSPMVRQAEQSDASSLAVLSMEVWLGTYIRNGVTAFFADHALKQFTAERFSERLDTTGCTILVSQNVMGIDGYIDLALGSQAPIDRCSDFEIATLYIQPRHHGKGKGAALLEAGLDLGRASNRTSVWLAVNAENERAIAFYDSHGFERIGETHHRIEDQSYLNYIMCREL